MASIENFQFRLHTQFLDALGTGAQLVRGYRNGRMLADGVAGTGHGTGNDDFVIHDCLPHAELYGLTVPPSHQRCATQSGSMSIVLPASLTRLMNFDVEMPVSDGRKYA